LATFGSVFPVVWDASSDAADWSAMSVRQKFDASGPVIPAALDVPSVRYMRV
jgi:hypothetical protein